MHFLLPGARHDLPAGDFSHIARDDKDEEEEGPKELGRTSPPASPQGEGETSVGQEDAGVEPPPGQPAPQIPQ